MTRALTVLSAWICGAAVAATTPWATSLYLGNDGYWRQRIAVTVRNQMDREAAGDAVPLKIGTGPGEAALAGTRAEDIRVCDAKGVEMLWAMVGPAGTNVTRGSVPAGGSLLLPVECPARDTASYFVYFDNPAAWGVPDFLNSGFGLRNGGLEEGEGDTPAAWHHDANDEQHRTFWLNENPHGGKKCLKTVVADGAAETWIATRQRDLRIVGGAKYTMRAWVKAENVKGYAGWYIHVGNDSNFMLISPMLNGGGGTYDWKEVTAEFVAPQEANKSDLGTVLRGTGTAWFDDVTVESADKPVLSVTAAPPERLQVTEEGQDAPWFSDAAGAPWTHRLPVRLLNPGTEARNSALVSVDLGPILARLQRQLPTPELRVGFAGKTVQHYRLRDILLFAEEVPARTCRTYYVCLRAGTGPERAKAVAPGAVAPANPALPQAASADLALTAGSDYERLLDSPRNLVRNPSFEQGEPLPADWPGGAEGERPAGTQMGLDTPGLFGQRCARIEIPKDSKPAWTGWRQNVPVQPGRHYLYAAALRCKDLDGGLQLHAHRRTETGALCQTNPMTGAGPALSGTADWALLSGVFETTGDCTLFQVHLTMLATGTAWHDGALVTEVAPGLLGNLETRAQASQAGLSVWPVNAIVKVFQEDLPPAQPPPARVSAARNEKEPLQLALRSSQAVAQLQIEVDAPRRAGGDQALPVEVGVVGYVPIDHATNYYSTTSPAWHRKFPTSPGACDGWPGLWPDPLLPHATCDLAGDRTQPVWLTVSVPKDAAAGDYQGTVRFVAAGRALASLPFVLHVWDFTLPDENHVSAIYDLRPDGRWSVPGKSLAEVRQQFVEFMAERRLCPDSVQPEPSLRYENGKVVADFAAFDQAATHYFDVLKRPHSYTPWFFYCFGWGHPPSERFGQQPYEGKYPFEGVDRARLRPAFKQAYQACLKVYWDHLKAKGWDRKCVLYISDEPFDSQPHIREQMKALCSMIHEVDPAIPIYCSTWHAQPEWEGYLNVWGIGHYGIVPIEKISQLRQAGARIWWTTDGQMCTDTPSCAIERLLPHYCFKYGAEAYEFWGVNWLTYDPYQYGWHSYIHQSDTPGKSYYVRYPNGDGFLAYPGGPIQHAGPVSSVRLEQAREGCEDFEYFYVLRDLVAKAKAAGRVASEGDNALTRAVSLVDMPSAGGRYSTKILPEPDRVFEVRSAVAQAIEALAAAGR